MHKWIFRLYGNIVITGTITLNVVKNYGLINKIVVIDEIVPNTLYIYDASVISSLTISAKASGWGDSSISHIKFTSDSTTGITETQNGFTPSQLKAWTWYAGPLGTKNQVITGLTEGSYRISIFASGSYDIRPANLGAYYQLIVNEGTYTLSGSHVHNNLDVWVSQELNIGASGVEIVYGNNGGTSGYSKIPINAVLIERLT